MAELVRYAAVGCGGMGRRHLRGMAALQGASFCNMELVAACDVKQEQAELLAGEAEQLLRSPPARLHRHRRRWCARVPELRAADVTVESGYTTGGAWPAWRRGCTSCARSPWPSPSAAAPC